MAEFSEVMRHARRMCNISGYDDDCEGCRLSGGLCDVLPSDWADVSIAEFEHAVMQWAAEHPEPKYPSWVKWLSEQGIIACGNPIVWRSEALQPIPADIAEKLGIPPKEG